MDTAIINHLEALASFYLGTPWQDNAGGPDAFDCWHWVRFCLVEIGYAGTRKRVDGQARLSPGARPRPAGRHSPLQPTRRHAGPSGAEAAGHAVLRL